MSSNTETATDPVLGGEVVIEAHGLPGTTGRYFGSESPADRLHFAPLAMWASDASRQDTHVAFRADVSLSRGGRYSLSVQASSGFRVWLDGETLISGPLRFAPAAPEYHFQEVDLSAGTHQLAVHAVGDGITNRMAAALPSFVWFQMLTEDGLSVPLHWSARKMTEYSATGLRISPLLGWMEWADSPIVEGWRTEPLGNGWRPVDAVDGLEDVLGPARRSVVALPDWPTLVPELVGQGEYRDTYPGYRWDDPAVQFLLADLAPRESVDKDGYWYRYDLGRIRIGSMELVIECDEPGEVTIAYCERLAPDGRPSPAVALSAGPTRMLQHFAIAAGRTRIQPLQSIGGRWIEVRIRTGGAVRSVDPRFRERDLLGPARGAIDLKNPELARIWTTGLDTLRASAEDALVDSVRERGEWVGDVVSSAMEILSIGWGDLRLVRRALFHAAAGARADGMVAGCGPGELLYLGTYAAQWLTACVRCAELEADLGILRELEDSGRENLRALVELVDDDGSHSLPWSFVDWGYTSPVEGIDVAVLCHILQAIDSWMRWQQLLHDEPDLEEWVVHRHRIEHAVREQIRRRPRPLGYHASVLAARVGLLDLQTAATAVRTHLLRGFPFNPKGSRLRDCTQARPDSVTPYFTNYSMPILIEAGETDLVLELWSRGWGWMLEEGATTWWEVFDDRWSQCHYWSGAPTWQATRYFLGLNPRLDRRGPYVELALHPGSLPEASGRIPLPGGGSADISWKMNNAQIEYHLGLDVDLDLMTRSGRRRLKAGNHLLFLESLAPELGYRVS